MTGRLWREAASPVERAPEARGAARKGALGVSKPRVREPQTVAIKILQSGAGLRGNHWAAYIRAYPDAECVAVVDVDRAALDRIKAKVQNDACAYFDDLDAALETTTADAALIVSPSALHARQAIRCMEAGLTVMIEKPSAPASRRPQGSSSAPGSSASRSSSPRTTGSSRPSGRSASCCRTASSARSTTRPWSNRAHAEPHRGLARRPRLSAAAGVVIHHLDSLAEALRDRPRPASPLRSGTRPGATTGGRQHRGADRLRQARAQYLGTMLSHRFGFPCGSRARGACSGPIGNMSPGGPTPAAGSGRSATLRCRPATRRNTRRAAPPRS